MSTATTIQHKIGPSTAFSALPLTATRSQICAAVAGLYVGLDTPYRPGGRDGAGFDGFGFVRACVQAALNWVPGIGATLSEPLPDLTDYMGWPVEEPSSATIAAWIERVGLVQVDKHYCKNALPGDVLMTLGRGPGASIITHGANHDRGQQVALVWAPRGPEIRPITSEGRMPVRAYRFPEAV